MNEVQMEKCTVCGNGVIVTEKIKALNGPFISWRCDKCGAVCNNNSLQLDQEGILRRIHTLEERVDAIPRIISVAIEQHDNDLCRRSRRWGRIHKD